MKKIWMALTALALTVSAGAADKKADEVAAKPDGFATTLNAGLSLTDGNSETLAANASLATEGQKEGLGSVLAGIEANYGESTGTRTTTAADGTTTTADDSEKTVENAKAYVNVKKTLSPRTFASLDGSVFYRINERVQIGLEMNNINNAEQRTYMMQNGAGDHITSWYVNDRRYAATVRVSF